MSDEWVVTMPKLGETVTEGTIGNWLKQAGDTVEFDDPLFEVSTDKVDSEIPSPYDGVIVEILVGRGRPCRSAPRSCGSVLRDRPQARRGRIDCRRRRTAWPRPADPHSATRRAPRWAAPRGWQGRTPASRVPSGMVHDITMPKLGETVTEGTIGRLAQACGRHGGVRRPALRGEHRQGRLGDSQPVRRRHAGGAGPGRGDRTGRHRARPHRRARRAGRPHGRTGPRDVGAARPRRPRRPHLPGPPPRPPTATVGCSPRWCVGSSPSAGLDVSAIPGPAQAAGSDGRTSERAIAGGSARAQAPAAAPAAPPRRPRPPPSPRRPHRRPPRHQRPPPSRPPFGSRRSARRGRAALPHAADRGGRHQGLADARCVGVDLRRGRFRQRRAGAAEAQGPVQEGDRRVALLPAVRRRGPRSTHCARIPPSTRRSTSSPRR